MNCAPVCDFRPREVPNQRPACTDFLVYSCVCSFVYQCAAIVMHGKTLSGKEWFLSNTACALKWICVLVCKGAVKSKLTDQHTYSTWMFVRDGVLLDSERWMNEWHGPSDHHCIFIKLVRFIVCYRDRYCAGTGRWHIKCTTQYKLCTEVHASTSSMFCYCIYKSFKITPTCNSEMRLGVVVFWGIFCVN